MLVTHSLCQNDIWRSYGHNCVVNITVYVICSWITDAHTQITMFMGPTWGPPGSYGPLVRPMNLAIRVSTHRLLHSLSLVAVGLLVGNATWPPNGYHRQFLIGWSNCTGWGITWPQWILGPSNRWEFLPFIKRQKLSPCTARKKGLCLQFELYKETVEEFSLLIHIVTLSVMLSRVSSFKLYPQHPSPSPYITVKPYLSQFITTTFTRNRYCSR